VTTLVLRNAFLTGSGALLFSSAIDMNEANAVEVTAEADRITEDTKVWLEFSNDDQNWGAELSVGVLTTTGPLIVGSVSGIGARYVRLKIEMLAAGLAIVSAAVWKKRL
jgi:hypothetical protein